MEQIILFKSIPSLSSNALQVGLQSELTRYRKLAKVFCDKLTEADYIKETAKIGPLKPDTLWYVVAKEVAIIMTSSGCIERII
jgi:hypothetical protein